MLINLSDVTSRDYKTVSLEAEIEADAFVSRLGKFPIVEKTPLKLVIDNKGNKELEISASADLTVVIPCSRCLEDVRRQFSLRIARTVDMKATDEDRARNLDESSYISGCTLDSERLVFDELIVQWPAKVLCREDCRGICSKCGANLNQGECGCDRESLDPRMAAFRTVFRDFGTQEQ